MWQVKQSAHFLFYLNVGWDSKEKKRNCAVQRGHDVLCLKYSLAAQSKFQMVPDWANTS